MLLRLHLAFGRLFAGSEESRESLEVPGLLVMGKLWELLGIIRISEEL